MTMTTRATSWFPQRAVLSFAAVALAVLAGCAVGPNYVPPRPDLPDYWHMELTEGLAAGQANLTTWWVVLDDPILNSLIRRARLGNLDLKQAVARIEEARARRGIARGAWFPTANTSGDYSYSRSSEALGVPVFRENPTDAYSLGMDSTWELDVFGRIRRSVEAAGADLSASVEDYRDVLVSLYAEVATNYVDLRAFQARLAYARSNAKNQKGTLKLTRDRNRAGLAPDLDVRQAELNLATTESFIPTFESQIARTIHRLGVLLGEHPGTLHAELAPEAPIPDPPPRVLVDVPTNLLRQRPDIRRAERQLAAETARIGVATADLYPRFSLFGTFAFTAITTGQMFDGDSLSFDVGPSMRWNVFDGGRIRSNIKAQNARTAQALIGYENTVLLALEETENAMVAYAREAERRGYLAQSVTAASQSVDLVKTLYLTGLTDFQNVLDMETRLFTQQDQLAESEGFVTTNLIAIYRALGGGWKPPAPAGSGSSSGSTTAPAAPAPASAPATSAAPG